MGLFLLGNFQCHSLFTSVLTSWETKCQIPPKVWRSQGISSPTALNHWRKRSQRELIVMNYLHQVHTWTQSSHLCANTRPQSTARVWLLCLCLCYYKFNWYVNTLCLQVFPSSYRITSFKIKCRLTVHQKPVDVCPPPPYVVYTNVYRDVFLAIGSCCCFGAGFGGTYTSDIIQYTIVNV